MATTLSLLFYPLLFFYWTCFLAAVLHPNTNNQYAFIVVTLQHFTLFLVLHFDKLIRNFKSPNIFIEIIVKSVFKVLYIQVRTGITLLPVHVDWELHRFENLLRILLGTVFVWVIEEKYLQYHYVSNLGFGFLFGMGMANIKREGEFLVLVIVFTVFFVTNFVASCRHGVN